MQQHPLLQHALSERPLCRQVCRTGEVCMCRPHSDTCAESEECQLLGQWSLDVWRLIPWLQICNRSLPESSKPQTCCVQLCVQQLTTKPGSSISTFLVHVLQWASGYTNPARKRKLISDWQLLQVRVNVCVCQECMLTFVLHAQHAGRSVSPSCQSYCDWMPPLLLHS